MVFLSRVFFSTVEGAAVAALSMVLAPSCANSTLLVGLGCVLTCFTMPLVAVGAASGGDLFGSIQTVSAFDIAPPFAG